MALEDSDTEDQTSHKGQSRERLDLLRVKHGSSQLIHSVRSLDKASWQGSAFSLPHNSYIDLSVIPPLPEQFDINKVPWWTSKRFSLAVLCFFGFLVLEASRANLSIAIVTMVGSPKSELLTKSHGNISSETTNVSVSLENETIYTLDFLHDHRSTNTSPTGVYLGDEVGEFQWSKELQGLILGSFFWGYLALQVIAGWLSEKCGSKVVIAVGMFTVSFATLLGPICARTSPYLLMAARIVLGLGQCVLYPSVQSLWMKWSPPKERSRLAGLSFAGGPIGAAVMYPIGGFLCQYGFDGGWPSTFYTIGSVCLLWTIIWCVVCYDCPGVHPTISLTELKYIEHTLGIKQGDTIKIPETPWRSILTSKAVWTIIITHVFLNYGTYMFTTQLPTYMKEVLGFNVQENGLYTMLPYLFLWFVMLVAGFVADYLIVHNILSILNTRKLMVFIGSVGPCVFLVGVSYMRSDQQVEAVIMLTLGIGLAGSQMSGFFMNTADIAPAFAGTLIGISNSIATIPGVIAPFVVGIMTSNGTQEEWQQAFYVTAGILFLGTVVFLVFAEGTIQSWGHIPIHDTDILIGSHTSLRIVKIELEPGDAASKTA